MSGVIHPVGPQNPRTYWIRRALLLGALISTVALLAQLFFGNDETPVAAVSAAPAPSESIFESALPTSSPISSSTAAAVASSSPTTVAAATSCSDDQISVKVTIDPTAPKENQSMKLAMTVTNTSATACQRDVGSGANEITIISGPALIWSTDHCNPDTTADVRTLAPNQSLTVSITWNGTQTSKGCVKHNRATAGTYWAHARNASKNSDGVRFVISK